MKKKSTILYKSLFLLLLAMLLVPIVQNKLNLITVSPLGGVIQFHANPDFSFESWFSGDYQNSEERYINESFGFRNIFVRLNNQIAFNLFHEAKANGVVIGKENYLFDKNYIKAYYGQDFIGVDSINQRMQRLKFISDTLKKLHKNVIIVFAAGKGSFYPEYFPDEYKSKKGITNHDAYIKAAHDMGLNYIDFDTYFVENKNKSKYSLYPKYGIHWSFYGECLVADSIIKYVEHLRNISMPHLYWNDVDVAAAKGDDYDIGNGMNLLFKFKLDTLAYPHVQFQSDSQKSKPSAIVISDSFFWSMFSFGIFNAFSDSHFWYYNKQIYPEYGQSQLETDQVSLKDEIAKHDVFIIMATESNLPNLGWGFIENTYNMFKGIPEKPRHDAAYWGKVKNLIDYIKTNEVWFNKIKEDANKKGIPLDSALTLNAIYAIDHPGK